MVNTIKFSEFVDGGDLSPVNTIVGLEGTNAKFTTFPLLPPGTTGDRPIVDPLMYYRLRFNTTLASYEYYSPLFGWVQLEDSVDVQDFPFVIYTAEPLLPNSFNLATLASGLLKQTVFGGIATPAIAINDIDYYGPGMMGYLQQPAGVKDINSNTVVRFGSVANATNWLTITNGLLGSVPSITAEGSDTNIGILIEGKGNGGIGLAAANTVNPFNFYSGTNYQHVTNFNMADTAGTRNVTWQDSDGTVAWLTDVQNTLQSIQGTENQILVNGTFGSPQIGNIIVTTPQDIGTTSSPTFNALTLTMPLTGANGGTNFNNGAHIARFSNGDLSFANAFTTSGNFAVTQTYTGVTNVTFPTSGTLATTSQLPTPASLTKTDDTNVIMTLGGTPATALLQAVSMTLGWTGQLSLTRGGTNNSLTASAGGIVWSDASKLNILAGTLTANQILLSGNAATPVWSTTTYPATNAINTIMYASSANVLGVITPVNSAVLVSSAGGVPSMSTTLPNINIGTPTAGIMTNCTATGGLRSFQIFTSGSSATYTKPANVTSILVEIVGGGGGGGGITAGATSIAVASGGGGGGYSRKYYASAAATYTYTVAASAAGGVGGTNGTAGNTTTFDVMTANGGAGGSLAGGISTSSIGITIGGAGGTASGGDINSQGSAGFAGLNINSSTVAGTGGGSHFAGQTAMQTATTANGLPGINYGGGGGGALGGLATSTSQNGGAGAPGLIIVWEFS